MFQKGRRWQILKPTTKKTTVKLGASAVLATGITLASRFDLAISSALAGLAKTENVFTLSVPRFAALLEIVGEWAPTLREALTLARSKGKLTLACGSLYLYKDLWFYISMKKPQNKFEFCGCFVDKKRRNCYNESISENFAFLSRKAHIMVVLFR